MSRIRKRIKLVYLDGASREYPSGGTALVFKALTDRDETVEIEIPLLCAGYSVVRRIREAMRAEIQDAQYALNEMREQANKD